MKAEYANIDAQGGQQKTSNLFSWLGFGQKSAVPAVTTVKPAAPSAPTVKPAPVVPSVKPSVAAAPPKSKEELLARGYVARGQVNKTQTASKIIGGKWNSPDTYYTIRNKVIPGSQIDPAKIEVGMVIWTKK